VYTLDTIVKAIITAISGRYLTSKDIMARTNYAILKNALIKTLGENSDIRTVLSDIEKRPYSKKGKLLLQQRIKSLTPVDNKELTLLARNLLVAIKNSTEQKPAVNYSFAPQNIGIVEDNARLYTQKFGS
jgi:hypothetical protein